MPAGIIPPNPNELMLSAKLDDLLSELRTKYDYIVLDTAPIGAVSDTFLLKRISDLSLYICRASYSDKRNLEYLNSIKKDDLLQKLYIVINDVDIESKRYGSKYGYGYGYGYKAKQ
jgi:Mrp family chromosome partitioning ATPase